jgi:hypothetical protein
MTVMQEKDVKLQKHRKSLQLRQFKFFTLFTLSRKCMSVCRLQHIRTKVLSSEVEKEVTGELKE